LVQDAAAMWDPNPDLEAARTLGDALRAAGYDERAIEERLGEDGVAADLGDSAVHERRLPADELSPVIRLFLLQRPVRVREARAALGRDPVDALRTLGFVEKEDGSLLPRARIVPTEGIHLSFDGFSRGTADPPGWVASFTPTAYWLASLTPRRRVRRALDIGTGNGAHALLAARHAERVVATDVNPRALAFTRISAALNRIDNVETRLGSLFEPVEGETFDLITSNAPYVISPERRWAYRDAGLPGDELSRRVVTEAAAHLAEGGFAATMVSWLAESEDDPDAHVESWVDGNGCDVWILGLSGSDALDHAAGWNDHFAADPDALAGALDEWAAYFRELGAVYVTEGAVVQHRRSGRAHLVRADAVEEDDLEFAGDQLERVFAAFELIAEEGDEIVDRLTLQLAEDVRLVEELDRDGDVRSTTLRLEEGTWPELDIEPELVPVLLELGGGRRLADAVAAAGDGEPEGVRDVVLDLLELGFLHVRA
jgi:methylase of polypeptide subunit release factors